MKQLTEEQNNPDALIVICAGGYRRDNGRELIL